MDEKSLPNQPLFSISEVHKLLSISRSQLYRLVSTGHMPRPRNIAGKPRYTREDLIAYITLAGRWFPGECEEEDDDGEKRPARKGKADES